MYPPRAENGRVLVPLRAIFEALDASVNWDDNSKTITAGNKNSIKLTVGKRTAFINGRAVELDVPAKIIKGRTLVPLRFVSEALGAAVEWQEESRTVVISYLQLDYSKVLALLKEGDLAGARKAAIGSPVNNPFAYLDTYADVTSGYTYYFPAGEATRYYLLEGRRITFVEPVNNVFTLTWQAIIGSEKYSGDGKLLQSADTLSKYLNNIEQKVIEEENGIQPTIQKSLVFFAYHPSVLVLRYGIIRPDGLSEVVGFLETGEKTAAFPGETLEVVPEAREL